MAGHTSWRDLQRAFLAFLNDRASSRDDQWLTVWQGFYEHSYFRRRMLEAARLALHSLKRTPVSEQELIAIAVMSFAKRIQSRRDTKSIVYIRDDFRGWLRSAVTEACQLACSLTGHAPTPPGKSADDSAKAEAIRIWAHALVATFPDPQRSILLLYLCGQSPHKIAAKLDLKRLQVHRMIRSGVDRLRWQSRQQR